MKNKNLRRGFSIIETALSLAILAIVTVSVTKYIISANRTALIQNEIDFRASFAEAMKSSFEQILDIYEPICSNITGDALNLWGWRHAQCSATSPLPVYVATGFIRYPINFGSLSAQNAAVLQNAIVGAYAPHCTFDSVTATTLTLRCPTLRNLTYNLGAGAVASGHVVNNDINPLTVPNVTMAFVRQEKTGLLTNLTNNFTLLDVYEKRRQFSLEKINLVRNALKVFHNTQMSVEVANSPTTGLNSINDEFVPWYWKAFGDSTALALGSICNVAGVTCANFNTNNIWRSTLSGNGLYFRRVVANLLGGDSRMTIDGFGNQITLYPELSQCANADITTCAVVAPPVPQNDYFNLMRPPFTSVLYINTFRDLTAVAPAYGRAYVSY